jgi:hypothetical protein
MNDWLGIIFIVLSIIGVFVGLKILAKPRKTTAQEFEKNVADSASLTSASMNALNEMLNPEAGRAKEIQTQLKEGRFDKKKREGKASGRARKVDDDILNAEIIE